jgi:putative N-acetyltransferase (TIGR04045 family)
VSTVADAHRADAAACTCRPVTGPGELAAYRAIRAHVFVAEQGVFRDSDLDDVDGRPDAVHVLGRHDGRAAGTVRLYPRDAADGTWQGDRLAVLPEFRRTRLGAMLVRFAVAHAGAAGGRLMEAHVQVANVRFFERLGWRADGEPETYVDRPHQRMRIALGPPRDEAPVVAGAGVSASPTARPRQDPGP